MKKLFFFVMFVIMLGHLSALSQVAINTDGSNADNSALLDVKSTNSGMLIPRMISSERNAISSPAEGLSIYNTENNCLEFWNGTAWYNPCQGGAYSPPFGLLFGGSSKEEAFAIQQTSDGGYIFAGESWSSDGDITGPYHFRGDYWIVKLDASGAISWDKMYGSDEFENCYFIEQTSDGGYIVGGGSQGSTQGEVSGTSHGFVDCWLLKLDASGNISWDKLYGGSGAESIQAIRQTSDGGYIYTGSTSSSASGNVSGTSLGGTNYWTVKLDASGNISWEKLYGGSANDQPWDVQQTTDGGYIVVGWSTSSASGEVSGINHGSTDVWVIKLDASGIITWENLYGGADGDQAYAISLTSDGGYILCGRSYSSASGDVSGTNNGSADLWVIKLDASGNISWENLYGGGDIDDAFSIQQTSDGGYIVGGNSYSSASGDVSDVSHGSGDYWILKLDATGNITWENLYGGNGNDNLHYINNCSDGKFIAVGSTSSSENGDVIGTNHGGLDDWIIKLDTLGNISW